MSSVNSFSHSQEWLTPDTSIRSVEMIDCLAEILERYLHDEELANSEEFIFPSPSVEGQPLSYATVHSAFKASLRRLGLSDCKIHSLRHSFSSVMLAAGVAIPTVSRNLGHSSPTITMDVYAHEIAELMGPSLQRADEVFRAARDELAQT